MPHDDESSSFHCLESPQLYEADLAGNEAMKTKIGDSEIGSNLPI